MRCSWKTHVMVLVMMALAGCGSPPPSYDSAPELGKTYGGPGSHGTAPLEPGAVDAGRPWEGPATAPANLVGPSDPKAGSLSALMGVQARAVNIVYVVDRAGGMAPHWAGVCEELYRSIGDLYADQNFAVVLMDKARPIVGPGEQLVEATKRQQGKAASFITQYEAVGTTSPRLALEKAFDLLEGTGGAKAIYFITHSPMLDSSLDELATKRNKTLSATIVTYMVGQGSPNSRSTLTDLAKAGNGTMKAVTPRQ